MIDRKFKFVATNPCKGNVFTEENAIVFCAHDKAVPHMLISYRKRCIQLGCDSSHITSIELLHSRVCKYQDEIESKIPDTETPCEIQRCIEGKV